MEVSVQSESAEEVEDKPKIKKVDKQQYIILSKSGIIEYLKLGLPSVLSIISEWWAYQVMILIASAFGVDYLAAHVVLITIISLEFQVACGLS